MTVNTNFKTRRDERGSVMIMTAILMFGIILAVGRAGSKGSPGPWPTPWI